MFVKKIKMRRISIAALCVIGFHVTSVTQADAAQEVPIFTSNVLGLKYQIIAPSKDDFEHLTLSLSGQFYPWVMDYYNNSNCNSHLSIHSNLFEGHSGGLRDKIDTISFKKNFYDPDSKIVLPKNSGAFLYKNIDVKKVENLDLLDISNLDSMTGFFEYISADFIDISSWNTRGKNTSNLSLDITKTSVKLGKDTIFSGEFQNNVEHGKMINQEDGFSYEAKNFFRDYDGTHPGTYKWISE